MLFFNQSSTHCAVQTSYHKNYISIHFSKQNLNYCSLNYHYHYYYEEQGAGRQSFSQNYDCFEQNRRLEVKQEKRKNVIKNEMLVKASK